MNILILSLMIRESQQLIFKEDLFKLTVNSLTNFNKKTLLFQNKSTEHMHG